MLSTKEIMLLLVSSVLVSSDPKSRPQDEDSQSSKREDQESDEMGNEAAMISEGGALQPQFTKPLDTKWTFWYEPKAKRDKGRNLNKTDYLKEVKRGKTFDTITSFWDCWSEVQRVCDCDCNYELFRHGVKPVWEDPRNIKGGKCVLITPQTTHEETMKHWVALMITLLIGEFGPEVNGVVLSTRTWGNMFAVWVRNSKDKETVDATVKQLQELFGPNTSIRFQRHQASMRKKFTNGNKPSSSIAQPVIPIERKQPGESEASSSPEGDKYKGKEQPRRSVVTAETKGMLHNLIQEATEAPLQPPIDKVNHREVDRSAPAQPEGVRIAAPRMGNNEEPMESSVERIPSYLGPQTRRFSVTPPNSNKQIVRKEVPSLSDLSAQQIGAGVAILIAGIAVSVLSWTYL